MARLIRPFLICGLGTLFYLYASMLRIMPSAMTQELMQSFQANAEFLGVVVGVMYYGYTLMQIPVGLLYDRFQARVLLCFALALTVVGSFLFCATNLEFVTLVASFFIGVGASFGFVGVLLLASRWFPPQYFAFIVGIVQLMGCAGSILGQGPIALAVNNFGWRETFMGTAIYGAVLAIFIYAFVRDRPENTVAEIKQKLQVYSERERLVMVSRNPQTRWIGLYSFCIWAPVLILAGLWIVPYLMQLYQISNTTAASMASWAWVGIGVGSPLFGWWSNRIAKRCMPLAVSAIVSFVTAIFILYVPHIPMVMMSVLLFLFGIGGSGQALSFGVVQDINRPETAGTAVGLNNMAVVLGAVILQPVIGWLLHQEWNGQTLNGAPIYLVSNYQHVLFIAPLCALISFVISTFFIKETRCEPQYSEMDDELKPSAALISP